MQPGLPAAHPLDDGTAVALHRSLEDTASALGQDAAAYRRLIGPFVGAWLDIARLRPVASLRRLGLAPLHAALCPGGRARAGALHRRAGAGALRRQRRPFDAAAGTTAVRRLRGRAADDGAHRRLAVSARWRGKADRGARGAAAGAGRTGGDRVAGGRAASGGSRPRRRRPARARPHRRPAPARTLCRGAAPLPARPGRLQARLGAVRADPVDGARSRPRRHGPSRRHARRARGVRAGIHGRVVSPSDRSSSSRSRAASIPREARPPGRTAMFRTARPKT